MKHAADAMPLFRCFIDADAAYIYAIRHFERLRRFSFAYHHAITSFSFSRFDIIIFFFHIFFFFVFLSF